MDMSAVQHNQYPLPSHTNTSVYTPMTPQAYLCNSPLQTSHFMMYNPPVTHGSPFPAGSPNSPMMHTTFNASNSTSSFNNSHQKYKYNRNGRYNGSQQNQQNNNYGEHTPHSTYDENSIYMNTQSVPATHTYEQEFTDSINQEASQMPPMYPSSPYCDPNMAMLSPQEILAHYNNNYENIETYGEDYDNYDDSCNGDDSDENLACQVCRGRRMCFCYFLKVRYYKFPSFFDLVDHQYKKWRKSIAQNNVMQQQQHQMISSPNGCVNQNNLSPNMTQTSITKKV